MYVHVHVHVHVHVDQAVRTAISDGCGGDERCPERGLRCEAQNDHVLCADDKNAGCVVVEAARCVCMPACTARFLEESQGRHDMSARCGGCVSLEEVCAAGCAVQEGGRAGSG